VRLNSYKYIYKAFTLRELDRVLQHIFCYKKKKKKNRKKEVEESTFWLCSSQSPVSSCKSDLPQMGRRIPFLSYLPLTIYKRNTNSLLSNTHSFLYNSFIHSFIHSLTAPSSKTGQFHSSHRIVWENGRQQFGQLSFRRVSAILYAFIMVLLLPLQVLL